jgi:hypothetical protein
MPVATTPPIMTVASLLNPVPVIVTAVPPVVLPIDGEMAETLGAEVVGTVGVREPHAENRNAGSIQLTVRVSTCLDSFIAFLGDDRRPTPACPDHPCPVWYLQRAPGGESTVRAFTLLVSGLIGRFISGGFE